jgi:hypothetical protein
MKIKFGKLRQLIREMAKPMLHGARHGKKFEFEGIHLVLDTKSDPEWVILTTAEGQPVARQSKDPSGHYYQQSSTNPDYEGRKGYTLDQFRDGEWHTYSSDARSGELTNGTFLRRTLKDGY